MKQVDEHTLTFCQITERTLGDMFGVATQIDPDIREENSVITDKTFFVSIHYTGTVFGEYLLAMDEETAARLIGIEEEINDDNRSEVRDEICDTLSEILNMVVGEAIVELQRTYAKLTITAPRVFFGNIRYPRFRTGSASMSTEIGDIECHFCLDLMRLNLAESYSEAMGSLLEVNSKLKDANSRLAEQQAQLVHSEKMASIGMLAAGVAHEINTPLFSVEVNLSTMDEYVGIMETTIELYEKLVNSLGSAELPVGNDDDDLDFILQDTKTLLAQSRESTTHIKSVVQKLKDFSNVDEGGKVLTDLNQLADNVISILGDQLKGCKIDCRFGEIPKVNCNPGEIGQVLINLLLNSVDALAGSEESIILETCNVDGEVVMKVRDSGRGISKEDLAKIFDPFFTTKDVGEGAGLGLSVSYGIVRKHGGTLDIQSNPGTGTQAIVSLPQESVSEPVCC